MEKVGAAIALFCWPLALTGCVTASPPAGAVDVEAELRLFRPDYDSQYKALKKRFRALKERVYQHERQGKPTWCLAQIVNETGHLLDDTALFAQVEDRLSALAVELQRQEERESDEVQGADGSWGACYQAWFLKLNATAEKVLELKNQGRTPARPLRLLDRVNSPAKLRAYLDSVLISDVRRTGVSHRRELNESTSEFMRLILRGYPRDYAYDPKLKETLRRFIDDEWQNRGSGWWGEWYRIDGQLVRTDDLSMSFHVISYRQGQVRRWPEIVATLVRNGNEPYPLGWRTSSGEVSNHHMYDAARIYRLGWAYLGEEARRSARAELRRMVDLCLHETMRPDGSFTPDRYASVAEAFYFGVSFLQEVGYFTPAKRFWTDESFDDAGVLKAKLLEHLRSLKGHDAREAIDKLTN